jgi:hypothetical protein
MLDWRGTLEGQKKHDGAFPNEIWASGGLDKQAHVHYQIYLKTKNTLFLLGGDLGAYIAWVILVY